MKFNLKYLFAIIPLLLVSMVIYFLSDIVTYILIAWVISMVGAPVVVFLRKYLNKNLAALMTLSLFLTIFFFIIWMFVPPLVNQIENLSKVDYDKVVTALEEPIKDWEKWLVHKKLIIDIDSSKIVPIKKEENNQPYITHKILLDSTKYLNDTMDKSLDAINLMVTINTSDPNERFAANQPVDKEQNFFDILKQNINTYLNPGKIQSIFSSTLSAFGNILIGAFSIFFIGFFFLREQGLFVNMLTSLVPVGYEIQTSQAIDETSKLLIRYFIGIVFQGIIITIIISASLTILGVKNALLIGFFAGLMNVIPYIGPIIATAVGLMITLSSNMDLSFYTQMIPLLTKVVIVFMITRLIDDIIIQPNVFSKSVKAHPLEIFIVVMVGAKIGGVMGMVFAIPFYTAFRVIGKVFLSEFKVIQKLTGHL